MARRSDTPGWRLARLVDMGGGLVTAVSPDLLNDNEAQSAQCVDLSQKGTVQPSLGRRDRYLQPFSNYGVRGLHAYTKKDGTIRLIGYAGGRIYSDTPQVVEAFSSAADWQAGLMFDAEVI